MQVEFLKVKDLATMLQLTPVQVHNLCRSDSKTPLPFIRINGHSFRFRRSDVEAWFAKHIQNSTIVGE
jgi:predicted DNA-binding transcriptional regulator AlpA